MAWRVRVTDQVKHERKREREREREREVVIAFQSHQIFIRAILSPSHISYHGVEIFRLPAGPQNPPMSFERIVLVERVDQVGRSGLFTDQTAVDEN